MFNRLTIPSEKTPVSEGVKPVKTLESSSTERVGEKNLFGS